MTAELSQEQLTVKFPSLYIWLIWDVLQTGSSGPSVLRCGLADGWGGSMMGTEFSDVLFGTPKPIDTEANLGVMVDENVNIVVHGHDPSLSEMVCEYADSKEMIDICKICRSKRESPFPVCAVLLNEVAMRRGVPMAGNFLQQEM